jgi:hypothetical protein
LKVNRTEDREFVDPQKKSENSEHSYKVDHSMGHVVTSVTGRDTSSCLHFIDYRNCLPRDIFVFEWADFDEALALITTHC